MDTARLVLAKEGAESPKELWKTVPFAGLLQRLEQTVAPPPGSVTHVGESTFKCCCDIVSLASSTSFPALCSIPPVLYFSSLVRYAVLFVDHKQFATTYVLKPLNAAAAASRQLFLESPGVDIAVQRIAVALTDPLRLVLLALLDEEAGLVDSEGYWSHCKQVLQTDVLGPILACIEASFIGKAGITPRPGTPQFIYRGIYEPLAQSLCERVEWWRAQNAAIDAEEVSPGEHPLSSTVCTSLYRLLTVIERLAQSLCGVESQALPTCDVGDPAVAHRSRRLRDLLQHNGGIVTQQIVVEMATECGFVVEKTAARAPATGHPLHKMYRVGQSGASRPTFFFVNGGFVYVRNREGIFDVAPSLKAFFSAPS
jgi:hypothetical protein